MGLFEDAINGLRDMAKAEGNVSKLAEKLEESPSLLSRWFDGTRKPNWSKLSLVLERVGARLVFPGQAPSTNVAQLADPLAQKVDGLVSVMRVANVAELEILRSVRSMLDAEIDKASSRYLVSETRAPFAALHEEPAPYKDAQRQRTETDTDPNKKG